MKSIAKSSEYIIQKYSRLIYKIANRVYGSNTNLEYEDLIQSGYEALLRAYKQFDKNKNYKEITYFYPIIIRAIRDEQNRQEQMVRISRSITDYAGYLYKAKLKYNDDEQIINYIKSNTNLTDNQINTLLNYKNISTKKDLSEYKMSLIEADSVDLDSKIDIEKMMRLIDSQLKHLPINQRLIIELKYFGGYEYEDIAKLINKRVENVWALHYVAIKSLRKIMLGKVKRKDVTYGLF